MSSRLRSWALARPGVLIIGRPGDYALRWRVEAEVDRRGWHLAVSAADAGLMLIIGEHSPELRKAADVLWSQMPHPRHRRVVGATDLGQQLDDALSQLITSTTGAENRVNPSTLLAQGAPSDAVEQGDGGGAAGHHPHTVSSQEAPGHDMVNHAGHEMGDTAEDGDTEGVSGTGHAATHGDGGMNGHSGHDMGGHMHHGGDIAGLAMAGTAPDRDGLELDELKVTLGPVLPGWPTGLILTASMQGDVLTGVKMSWTEEADENAVDQSHADPVLVALDALAGFSLVAGWPLVARQARDARTELLTTSGEPAAMDQGRRSAAVVARKVRRSRLLAWSLRGMGSVGAGSAQAAERQQEEARPLHHRTRDVLDRVRMFAAVAAQEESSLETVRMSPESIELLVEGAELAAARLIVASFVPVPWATASMRSADHGASGHHGAGHD